MLSERFGAGPLDGGTQNKGGDDGVVRISDDGDEVGNEVDGDGEVGQEEPEPHAHSAGQGPIAGEACDEADEVGKQPGGVGRGAGAGSADDEDDDEREPERQERNDGAEEDPE